MRKIIFIFALTLGSLVYAQDKPLKTVPMELIGIWKNLDNEFLKIDLYGNFQRGTSKGIILARGHIEIVASEYFLDQEIRVYREDTDDSYSLGYVIRNKTFVVTKPNDASEAWVFEKLN